LLSAVISLTLTPMMCSLLLRPSSEKKHGRFYEWSERMFNNTIAFYGRTVKFVLKHQTITLIVTIATLVATIFLYIIVPKGFFPVQDTGVIMGISDAPESISFDAMAQRQQALAASILKDKDVESLSSFIGVDGTNTTPNSGRIQINLKPIGTRKDDVTAVMKRLQQEIAGVEGITLYMQPVQDLTVEDRVSRTQYQFSLEDADSKELRTYTTKLLDRLKSVPELRDVATDQQNQAAQATLVIDRDTASRMGVTASAIDNTLYDAFGQRLVSIMFTQLNQYHVVLLVDQKFSADPDSLKDIYVPAGGGQSIATPTLGSQPAAAANSINLMAATASQVPLSAIAHWETTTGPLTINHQGQFPAVTISFNLGGSASLGEAVKAIQQAASEINMPPSIQLAFQGTARAFQASLDNEGWLILAAIVTVYIVLGVLYESYIHPITILSTLPSAGVGAILALLLFHMDLSVMALIGIILLIGIVKKNAIMMIDFALEAERKEGKAPVDAIYEACLLRFRPIMMTTFAALFGAVPLALGSGTGSELRRPLGVTIIGGLIFSQVLTLYTTPVVYLWFDRLAAALRHVRAPKPIEATGD
jgi:multidrug efflux pump